MVHVFLLYVIKYITWCLITLQKFSKKQILEELVPTAIHWIEAGLPLRCLKIVLLETDPENTALILRFKTIKESYCAGKMEKQKVKNHCMVFIICQNIITYCIQSLQIHSGFWTWERYLEKGQEKTLHMTQLDMQGVTKKQNH